jgi:mevalonate kinase
MLFGEHAVVHNRPCLVTAVDSRMKVCLKKLKDKKIKILAPEVSVFNYERKMADKFDNNQKGVCFIESAIKVFRKKYPLDFGLDIQVKNGFSCKYGLGSSSAVTVCVIKGLAELYKIKLAKKEIFDLAYKAILDIQGVGSGFDVACAIWGGTIFFVTGGKKIKPLKVKKLPLVIAYTGIKADTPAMIRKIDDLRFRNYEFVEEIFNKIEKIVLEARKILEKGEIEDIRKLGELMNKNQNLLVKLGVSSPKIDCLVKSALKAGAYGAKLSGAGGGDCIIALASQKKRHLVEQALVKTGGELVPIETGAEGIKTG